MKKILIMLMCILTLSTVHAYAIDVKLDRDTNIVTVEGQATADEQLAVVVTTSAVDELNDNTTSSQILAASVGFYEVSAAADGKYTLSFKSDQTEDTCWVHIAGESTKDKEDIDLYSKTTLDTALGTLSTAAASGSGAVQTELLSESFRKTIGVNELYNRIADKAIIANAIAANTSYTTYAQLTAALSSVEAQQNLLDKFNAMINKVQVKELVRELQTVYGGNADTYTKYFGLTSTDTIDQSIYSAKPFASIQTVFDKLSEVTASYNEPPRNQGGGGGGGGGGTTGIIYNNKVEEESEEKPAEDTKPISTFSDVSTSFWGYESIEALYKMGIVSGVDENNFAPSENVKREQFVKMIVAALGMDVGDEKDSFTDTDKNAWYSPYLAVAEDLGLVYGKADGRFGVGEELTREDMAVLAARAIGKTTTAEAVEFSDADGISAYARESINQLYKLGIMSGLGDGSFGPKQTATRAQAARVVYEIVKILG